MANQIEELQEEIRRLNVEKGWRGQDKNTVREGPWFAAHIALAHSVSEALEAYRDKILSSAIQEWRKTTMITPDVPAPGRRNRKYAMAIPISIEAEQYFSKQEIEAFAKVSLFQSLPVGSQLAEDPEWNISFDTDYYFGMEHINLRVNVKVKTP